MSYELYIFYMNVEVQGPMRLGFRAWSAGGRFLSGVQECRSDAALRSVDDSFANLPTH